MKNDKHRNLAGSGAHSKGGRSSEDGRRAAYLRQRFSGGRGALARAVDYIALRLIVLLAAYLFFAPRFEKRGTVLLLSGIALGIVILILRLMREIRFARFTVRERKRIHRLLLCDRLLVADAETLLGLVGRLCPLCERAAVLQCALPVSAETLLGLLRIHAGCCKVHVFSCSPFDRTAEAFAVRFSDRLTLHAPEELLCAAERAGLSPDSVAVDAYIDAEYERARANRKLRRLKSSPFAAASTKKYLLTSLVLVGISFLTRYTLYYRMLAGVCAAIAAGSAVLTRGVRTHDHEAGIG